ncbi:hypothetical protein AB4Z30_17970 [Paenibacillus sp. 2TAF8]|uniref:hypothetical protein n=1 Tax=Paenibacillus sp. 2TAF8 TaxID=3233020 RepID=UPI003F95986B
MSGKTEGWIAGSHGSDVSRIFQFAEIVLGQWMYYFSLFTQAKRQQRTSSPLHSLIVAYVIS